MTQQCEDDELDTAAQDEERDSDEEDENENLGDKTVDQPAPTWLHTHLERGIWVNNDLSVSLVDVPGWEGSGIVRMFQQGTWGIVEK